MGQPLKITRVAELESLPVFRAFVDEGCRQAGIDADMCFALKLAVDEACSNIIIHGYAGMNPGSIIVEFAPEPERAVVRITDFGHPFEPSEVPAPDVHAALEDRPLGGFGLYFIYSTMDDVAYAADELGNCLTLTKRLDPGTGRRQPGAGT
jgi:serine/threonine-protein kinase RsbW